MAKKKGLHLKVSPTKQLVAAGLLFVLSVYASRPATISPFESDVFYAVYNLPQFLYPFFYVVTQLGSIYVLGVLLLLYLLKQYYHIVLRLLLTGTLAYLVAGFAKSIWGRARPQELLPNIITLDYFQGPGFPSGHVALATALALTIGHYLPRKYWWVPALWIIGVGLSRMYLGVHAPLDIVGGFALGWLCYALFRHVRIYDTIHHRRRTSNANSK